MRSLPVEGAVDPAGGGERAFSLYVHIPYCLAKCPYCDFNSHAAQRWPEGEYVDALCHELRRYARADPWRDAALRSIFLGGGTPSLFAPQSVGRILRAASDAWQVDPAAEITVEANPGTVSAQKLEGYRAAGVNRISFGIQSFQPRYLKVLGRIHDAADARNAVRLARAAGFDDVNTDLIYALPNQTLDEWERDLGEVCELHPEHVSAYNLTYEEGTAFYEGRARGRLKPLDEEIELAMFERCREILAAAGYRQYEISNYAQPGRECRHNLNYWRGGEYLGLGAGAHSYRALRAAEAWGERWSNHAAPVGYMESVRRSGHARANDELLNARQARGEFVFLGLRLNAGFAAGDFAERFGEALHAAFPHVETLTRQGVLEQAHGRWKLTPRGLAVADTVFASFL